MTKEEFKAKVSMAYEGVNAWEQFLEAVWQLNLEASNNWISVEERLPKKAKSSFMFSDMVLVCDINGFMDTAAFNYNMNRWEWLNNVTHWMPLPSPPRKEE